MFIIHNMDGYYLELIKTSFKFRNAGSECAVDAKDSQDSLINFVKSKVRHPEVTTLKYDPVPVIPNNLSYV